MSGDATLELLVNEAARRLREAGFADARREARRLVTGATGVSAAELISAPDAPVCAATAARLERWLARRLTGEPLSRISGARAFYGRNFEVTPDVLDPRPETELIVDVVLEWADEAGRNRPWRILDLGTGTGCLAITLLAELPEASAVAVDVSEAALAVAAANAGALAVSDRLQLECADLRDGISGTFNIVVSNPPYIPGPDIAHLDVAVRNHDPHVALDGGPDGLSFYRSITQSLSAIRGLELLVLEVGMGQAARVGQLVNDGWPGDLAPEIVARDDLAGLPRVVAATQRRA
ncbi:MAG: peptide chain release factor N(5)-glutamine methyltransferase [Pseudomonadota bacterium]